MLATASKAMDVSVQTSFESLLSGLWGTRPEVGLLDCLVLTYFLNFLRHHQAHSQGS